MKSGIIMDMKKILEAARKKHDKNNNKIPDFIERWDENMIKFFWKNSNITARWALFIIFFWFGILKVFGVSPAGPLVTSLVEVMFGNSVSPQSFLIYFGAFEAITGFLILLPKFERITFAILASHFVATAAPLLILSEITWYGVMQPTLVGQYILKNLALLAIGMFLYGRLRPMSKTNSMWGEDKVIN
ncbi:MAG: hypothetical protein ACI870_000287 [Crocinitomicaceae bacterium]|jgi:hypothetical protein